MRRLTDCHGASIAQAVLNLFLKNLRWLHWPVLCVGLTTRRAAQDAFVGEWDLQSAATLLAGLAPATAPSPSVTTSRNGRHLLWTFSDFLSAVTNPQGAYQTIASANLQVCLACPTDVSALSSYNVNSFRLPGGGMFHSGKSLRTSLERMAGMSSCLGSSTICTRSRTKLHALGPQSMCGAVPQELSACTLQCCNSVTLLLLIKCPFVRS